MRRRYALFASFLLLSIAAATLTSGFDGVKQIKMRVPGLKQQVEVFRDRWGVPHIYAQNTDDLFFAQGYITASDRLFQLDMWRRIGTGKLSEVFGPDDLGRDRIARLVRFRGNWDEEWNSYSPDAKQIVTAFTSGINAYIQSLGGKRPEEFRVAGFDPGLWKPEDVAARIAGLTMTGNVLQEVNRSLQVTTLGLATAQLLAPPDPKTVFAVPHGVDLADITSAILRDYTAAIAPIRFPGQQGSNNWVIDGSMSKTGKPLLANDPHRAVLLPSLRKTVHLVAPGWNVIGAGEPALPGVALGHNEDIAFAFTIVGIDQQDLYVEKTNPDNPTEYMSQGVWKKFRIEHDSIPVKGAGAVTNGAKPPPAAPVAIDLKYSTHGPIIYEDPAQHRAYALHWVGETPGTAGYLPALSLSRAKDWREFQDAVARYKVPSENLIYADRKGNIGWIAAGLAPVRKGWNGLFPVPGDTGEYEWTGFLPASDHPSEYNPRRHYIATANQNILPPGYKHELSYYWASPERYERIVEMLHAKSKFGVDDFEHMQQDTVSLVARDFVTLLTSWHPAAGSPAATIKAEFSKWNADIALDSREALIYEVWTARLRERLTPKVLPAPRTSPRVVMQRLKNNPELNQLLSSSLTQALSDIEKRLGPDQAKWTWGNLHKVTFAHPLTMELAEEAPRERKLETFDLKPVSRPGDANTVNATGGVRYMQEHGASYREVIDLSDWDNSVMTNAPGESGVPNSKHYADLVSGWADGIYHPMPFSRKAVEDAAEEHILLQP